MNHSGGHPAAQFPPSQDIRRPALLQSIIGFVCAGCALTLALIFYSVQRAGCDPAEFAEAMQAAEKAETPEDGIRLVDRVMSQHHLDLTQQARAGGMRLLLQKRAQVDAMLAAASEDAQPVRRSVAVADIPPPVRPPALAPDLALAEAQTAYLKGVRLACGVGMSTNAVAAFALINQAATAGLPDAQHDLASMYAAGTGCATDLAAAVSWCRKAAEQGDVEAQAWLGYRFVNGRDLPSDPVQAARWNEKAAAQGHAVATLNLGLQYASGRGVWQDYARAFALFTAAAGCGNAEAQANLGVLYWKGLGVEKNVTNAVGCFQKAYEGGSAQGTFALGLLYGIGAGVAHDRQKAAALCLAAARSGHVGAQKQMGRMFLAGNGVPASEQDAIYWYRQAAAQGDEAAQQAVDVYHKHLSPVFAPCETCLGKGVVPRVCPDCHGTGRKTEKVTSTSIKNCVCGWQMVNGRCPNCGRVDPGATQTRSVACTACQGTGRLSGVCKRCSGSGQVHVAGPAQTTFAQMVNRSDPGCTLAIPNQYTPVPLHPFRSGINRGGGL